MTASDEEKIQEDRDRLEFAEVDEAVGFCKVIRKISESKKIVVGHNMFLDILYTLQQFVAPLPEDYDEFKVNVLFHFFKKKFQLQHPFYVPYKVWPQPI